MVNLLAIPSPRKSSGVVQLEVMAWGAVVVAIYEGGSEEIIKSAQSVSSPNRVD